MDAPRPMSWRFYPLLTTPHKTVLLVVLLFGIAAGLFLFTGEWSWVVLGVGLLLLSLRRYLLPASYTLDEKGARYEGRLFGEEIEWLRVRRVVQTAQGVFLSPFTRPSRLEGYRGLLLLCPPEKRDEVAAAVDAWRQHARVPGGSR